MLCSLESGRIMIGYRPVVFNLECEVDLCQF